MSFIADFVKDLTGATAANNAADAQTRLAGLSEESAARIRRISDMLMQRFKQAEGQGLFDASKREADFLKQDAQQAGVDRSNLAGQLRTLGYGPGDSEVDRQIANQGAVLRDRRQRGALDAKLGALKDYLTFARGTSPELEATASGIETAGLGNQANYLAQQASGQQNNLSGLLGTLTQYFGQRGGKKQPSASDLATARKVGGKLWQFGLGSI